MAYRMLALMLLAIALVNAFASSPPKPPSPPSSHLPPPLATVVYAENATLAALSASLSSALISITALKSTVNLLVSAKAKDETTIASLHLSVTALQTTQNILVSHDVLEITNQIRGAGSDWADLCFSFIPPTPSQLGSAGTNPTNTNVLAINGVATNFATVTVGSTVSLEYTWLYDISLSNCPGCITYLSLGAANYQNACTLVSGAPGNYTVSYAFTPTTVGCTPLAINVQWIETCIPAVAAYKGYLAQYVGAVYAF